MCRRSLFAPQRYCAPSPVERPAGRYPNFVEEPADASMFFDPDTWRRLPEVKALYDPDDLFKGNHHIPPADTALARVAAG